MNIKKSKFHLSKMDCPSEERMIRMKLDELETIKELNFDLENRDLTVIHSGEQAEIERLLAELDLGLTGVETAGINNFRQKPVMRSNKKDRQLLRAVLAINFGFFIVEMTTGLLSRSMGLVADSLDMLADSVVYGLSLWAVGAAIARKKRVARVSGYFQILLAVLGLIEVVRRFLGDEAIPDFRVMIIVSMLALIANSVSLYLLQKSGSKEVHMRASMIFTSNDVIINIGVIIAGVLVLLTNSKYPDLIVGAIVFLIVVRGAVRILKLGK